MNDPTSKQFNVTETLKLQASFFNRISAYKTPSIHGVYIVPERTSDKPVQLETRKFFSPTDWWILWTLAVGISTCISQIYLVKIQCPYFCIYYFILQDQRIINSQKEEIAKLEKILSELRLSADKAMKVRNLRKVFML